MGKAKKAGRARPLQPLGSSLGLVNPFKVTEDHSSTYNLPAPAPPSPYERKKPANDEQSSHSATNAQHAPLRLADDTLNSFHAVRAFGDHTQRYHATSYDSPVNNNTESFVHEKVSNYVFERPAIPIAVQDNAFHSQFETVRKTTTGSSLYNTMTVTEYLNHNQDARLVHEGTDNHGYSCLTLDSSMSNPGCGLDKRLFQPSADVLDFLELRRNFNTWLQISRLRNESRHPTLKQYTAAVLEEFENGYKDLEDKLAEKLFPLSGVRYQKARV
ncbi:hypothetical protein MMC17_008392 [Xylographa soralifera]|nr:hypothetical protein [Xylographa soralifera]